MELPVFYEETYKCGLFKISVILPDSFIVYKEDKKKIYVETNSLSHVNKFTI